MRRRYLMLSLISAFMIFTSSAQAGVLDKLKDKESQQKVDSLSDDDLYEYIINNELMDTAFYKKRIESSPEDYVRFWGLIATRQLLNMEIQPSLDNARKSVLSALVMMDFVTHGENGELFKSMKSGSKFLSSAEIQSFAKVLSPARSNNLQKRSYRKNLSKYANNSYSVLLAGNMTNGVLKSSKDLENLSVNLEYYRFYRESISFSDSAHHDSYYKNALKDSKSRAENIVDLLELKDGFHSLGLEDAKLVNSTLLGRDMDVRVQGKPSAFNFVIKTLRFVTEIKQEPSSRLIEKHVTNLFKRYGKPWKAQHPEYKPFFLHWLKIYEKASGSNFIKGERIVFS